MDGGSKTKGEKYGERGRNDAELWERDKGVGKKVSEGRRGRNTEGVESKTKGESRERGVEEKGERKRKKARDKAGAGDEGG